MPNLLTYNFILPNNEIKAFGPFRNAHTAAYYLLKEIEVEYVLDHYGNKFILSASQPGYIIKNGHLLKVEDNV